MRAGPSLNLVKANCQEILHVLEENYDKHKKLYAELYLAYRQKAVLALEARFAELKQSQPTDVAPVTLAFQLEPPDDHRPDYERAIGMLKLQINAGEPTIAISAEHYAAYVQDRWGWEEEFWAKNATMYGLARRR